MDQRHIRSVANWQRNSAGKEGNLISELLLFAYQQPIGSKDVHYNDDVLHFT